MHSLIFCCMGAHWPPRNLLKKILLLNWEMIRDGQWLPLGQGHRSMLLLKNQLSGYFPLSHHVSSFFPTFHSSCQIPLLTPSWFVFIKSSWHVTFFFSFQFLKVILVKQTRTCHLSPKKIKNKIKMEYKSLACLTISLHVPFITISFFSNIPNNPPNRSHFPDNWFLCCFFFF